MTTLFPRVKPYAVLQVRESKPLRVVYAPPEVRHEGYTFIPLKDWADFHKVSHGKARAYIRTCLVRYIRVQAFGQGGFSDFIYVDKWLTPPIEGLNERRKHELGHAYLGTVKLCD